MSNPGGRLSRSVVSPETIFIDHESRIKILERGVINVVTGSEGVPGILSGFGPPVGSVGFEGDWYIDLTNDRLYGPKGGVVWTGHYYDLSPFGMVWRGEYDDALSYDFDNIVELDGSAYIALQTMTPGFTPTNTAYWGLLVQKGDIGDTGPRGLTGSTGSTGAQGPAGLTWRGNWVANTFYQQTDVVYYA